MKLHLTISTTIVKRVFVSSVIVLSYFVASCGGTEDRAPSEASHGICRISTVREIISFGPKRRDAATRLAKDPGATSWIAWFLASDDPFLRGHLNMTDDTTKELDRAVIAAILENLPDNVPSEVLLAVTCQLKDSGCGVYSERKRRFLVITSLVTSGTPPIREMAVDVLKRNLNRKSTYDFDAVRWREIILDEMKPSTDAGDEKKR